MSICQNIFRLLKEQGRTAKELGDYIGVATSSISAWKNEGSYPSSKYVISISEFFNIPIEYLFYENSTADKSSVNNEISNEESELMNTYRKLDSRGRYKVQTVAYEELDRIEKSTEICPQNKQDIVS